MILKLHMQGSVKKLIKMGSCISTASSNWRRSSVQETQDSSTFQTLIERAHTIQTPRFQEGTLTLQTTSLREEYMRNEDYLELQDAVLRNLGILYGETSSRNPLTPRTSSADVNENNLIHTQHNCEISNTWPTKSGHNQVRILHPNSQYSMAYPSPLKIG
ncbi:C3 [Tomato apical leaf curl virus]|uniref:C3 n=1 Tax=Tomato apical leaf curl virus TaxID=2060142 RepID=A0A2H4Z9M1_9GEMI|nr:C3 [Tomato apical leaf curl virus]AUF71984.1 C3 [Tomato apical leaf curl virus]